MNGRFRTAARVVWVGAAVLAWGTAGYALIEGADLFDALYMTVITVSTIGYGEVFPLSVAGRAFTIVLAFAGVGVMIYAVSEIAAVVVETDLRRVLGLRREHQMIRKLSKHIVICGAGRTGSAVADILRSRQVPFVVVERDPDICRRLEGDGSHLVVGDATQKDVLVEAGVPAAATLIATLAEDAHNVYAILLARQLNPGITIIARAAEEGSEERLTLAGANRVINPYRTGAMRLAFTAIKPTGIDFVEASLPGTEDDLELAEVPVQPGSQLADTTLAGADVRKRFGVIVVALKRGERSMFNPAPDVTIEAGDILVALGTRSCLEKLERASE